MKEKNEFIQHLSIKASCGDSVESNSQQNVRRLVIDDSLAVNTKSILETYQYSFGSCAESMATPVLNPNDVFARSSTSWYYI